MTRFELLRRMAECRAYEIQVFANLDTDRAPSVEVLGVWHCPRRGDVADCVNANDEEQTIRLEDLR